MIWCRGKEGKGNNWLPSPNPPLILNLNPSFWLLTHHLSKIVCTGRLNRTENEMLQCCLCTAIGAAHICRVYLGAASTTPPPPPPPPPRCSLPTSLPLLSSAAPAVFPIVAQPALPLTAHPFDQYLLLGEQIVDSEAKCCLRSKFDLSFVVLESFGGQASPSLVKYRDSCSPSINKVSTTYQQNIITK